MSFAKESKAENLEHRSCGLLSDVSIMNNSEHMQQTPTSAQTREEVFIE